MQFVSPWVPTEHYSCMHVLVEAVLRVHSTGQMALATLVPMAWLGSGRVQVDGVKLSKLPQAGHSLTLVPQAPFSLGQRAVLGYHGMFWGMR